LFARMPRDAIVIGEDICYFCFARVGRAKKETVPKADIVPKTDIVRLRAMGAFPTSSRQRPDGAI